MIENLYIVVLLHGYDVVVPVASTVCTYVPTGTFLSIEGGALLHIRLCLMSVFLTCALRFAALLIALFRIFASKSPVFFLSILTPHAHDRRAY